MKSIFLIIVLLLVSCNSEKNREKEKFVNESMDLSYSIQNSKNNILIKDQLSISADDLKWRIFENNIEDTLRLFRNNIYAKHGYQFKSLDLQNYFNSKSWYKINPEYKQSLLTEADILSIKTINKFENFLNELSPDSIKILKNIFNFRNGLFKSGYDSTICQNKDITGDGIIDNLITKIKFEYTKFSIQNTLVCNNEILWSEKKYLSPCLQFISENDKILQTYPQYGYYYTILNEYYDTIIPSIRTINYNFIKKEISDTDTVYVMSNILYNCEDNSEWFKKYLYNFKGQQVSFPDIYCLYEPSSSYKVKIWNSATKNFIFLWSGP